MKTMIGTSVPRFWRSRMNQKMNPWRYLSGMSSSDRVAVKDGDLVVVGTGVAGCSAALKAAHAGLKVKLLTSAHKAVECNSYWAQGGIIYRGLDDSPDLLAKDIHRAGAGLCDDSAVDMLTHEGPNAVEQLLLDTTGAIPAANVPFDRDPSTGELSLCLEASHNRARIIHWKDHTGKAITEQIVAAAKAHPNVELLTGMTAVDLAVTHDQGTDEKRCVGVHVLHSSGKGVTPMTFAAPNVVLATGGIGALYAHTSNPPAARGEGIGMAVRAGAEVDSLEYVQFHPTTLYVPGAPRFLLTEALRGEGAVLRDRNGRAFAKDYHEDGELAPRDVVARMITAEMTAQEEECMWLDISHRDGDWLKGRFPSIYQYCLEKHNFDITAEPMPIVPSCHFSCGGVSVDTNARTSLPGLLATGEVACTGLHGANRLASTSLLEGLVWGIAAAETAVEEAKAHPETFKMPEPLGFFGADEAVSVYGDVDHASILSHIQEVMWEGVGIVRTPDGMQRARSKLLEMRWLTEELVARAPTPVDPKLASLRNAAAAAASIADAASRNHTSAGAHYVEDVSVADFEVENKANLKKNTA